MQIVENFLEGKKPDQIFCEDDFFFNEHFAAVIDGSTAKTKNTYRGMSPGKNASLLIKNALQNLAPTATSKEVLLYLNLIFQQFYQEENIYDLTSENPFQRAGASLVIYSKYFHQLWFWGDCQALVGANFYFFEKKIDAVFAEMRSVCLEIALLEGQTIESLCEHDLGRAYIQEMIIKGALFQNQNHSSPFYYEKIDGFGVFPAIEIQLQANEKEIILASDGYPKVLTTLAATENYLQEIIREDPLLFRKFKATKGVLKWQNSFDDRCYLKFLVE